MREAAQRPLKKMGGYVEFLVYLSCLTFLLNLYASFITFFGVFGHLLSFLIASCILFGLLLRFRIPKPNISTVSNLFGSDWGAYKVESGDQKIENNYVMKVVGHRSCGLDAPENSLSALHKVSKEGISAVEFDVMVTKDNVPIVFHDSNLLRMTNICKEVKDTTFEEIRKLDISVNHPFGKNFKNEKIPSLDEYVSFGIENQIRMFLDLKEEESNIVQIITDLYKQYPNLYELGVVSSFNPLLIYKIRSKDPKIVCSLAWRPYFYSHQNFSQSEGPSEPRSTNLFFLCCLRILNHIHHWFLWKFGYYLLGLSALLLHKDIITRENVQYWTKRGIRVIAWSVNLPTEKQYFEKILEVTYLTDTVINS